MVGTLTTLRMLDARAVELRAPNSLSNVLIPVSVLSMKTSSVGVIAKNVIVIVIPRESCGNFWPNRSATRAMSIPVTTAQSPRPWRPRVSRRSGAYSSIAKPTRGRSSTLRAEVLFGRVQK